MGVTGLIKFVDEACEPGRIESLKGCTVAIDSSCLLHKGAYSCCDKIVQGVKTTAYVDYVMKYIKLLKHYKINIIMVFDGMANTSKAETEKKRKKLRMAAKAKGAELLAAGKVEEARKQFSQAVEIKHEHALALMEACRAENVDCITSMYEADAQLAYLNKIGLADYVISEDSDLILFGCKKIVFKLALSGHCVLFDSSKLHLSINCPPEKFSLEKFRKIAIMSGCDYLDSLPGIGLAKAAKFMKLTEETDMRRALVKIPSYLNMSKLTVTQEYIEGFLKAEATFKYMFVYDPIKKKMVRLNEIEDEDDEKYCSQTGKPVDEETAYQIALGNINPRTFQVVTNYDPLKPVKPAKNSKVKVQPHLSIWKSNLKDFKNFKPLTNTQVKMTNFVPITRVADIQVRKIIEQENDVEEEIDDEMLLDQYGRDFAKSSSDDSCKENKIEVQSETTPTRKNPFAKLVKVDNSLNAEETSLISKVNKPVRVVSRFFTKSESIQSTQETAARALQNRHDIEKEIEARVDENTKFYDIVKYSFKGTKVEIQETKDSQDDDDVILVTEEEPKPIVKPKVESTSKAPLKPSKSLLSLKRKAPSASNSIPKLAKFGFTRTVDSQ